MVDEILCAHTLWSQSVQLLDLCVKASDGTLHGVLTRAMAAWAFVLQKELSRGQGMVLLQLLLLLLLLLQTLNLRDSAHVPPPETLDPSLSMCLLFFDDLLVWRKLEKDFGQFVEFETPIQSNYCQ